MTTTYSELVNRLDLPTKVRLDTARGGWDTVDAGGQLLIARGLGDIRATIDLDRAGEETT